MFRQATTAFVRSWFAQLRVWGTLPRWPAGDCDDGDVDGDGDGDDGDGDGDGDGDDGDDDGDDGEGKVHCWCYNTEMILLTLMHTACKDHQSQKNQIYWTSKDQKKK